MPGRLVKPYNGQAAGTVWSGTDQERLRSLGIVDDRLELATDYAEESRIVTDPTANAAGVNAIYIMNSATAQTLTIQPMGGRPLNGVLTVIQRGAGKTTIVPGTGVTINTAATNLVTLAQYNVVQLIMIERNTWIAFGGLGG